MAAPIADNPLPLAQGSAIPTALIGSSRGLPDEKARLRRETAVTLLAAILSGPSGSSGGIDNVTDRALEWTDFLLEKLAK